MAAQSTRTFRSAVKPELIRSTLSRRGWVAVLGASLIVLTGTVLPFDWIKLWGLPLFLIGLVLVAFGILPYRKLSRLQLHPHRLEYDGEFFHFLKQGKPLFKIPEISVDHITFLEKELLYGVAVYLKKPAPEKVVVLDKRFDIEAFVEDSKRRFDGCDLFLPYFSKKTVQDLKALLESDHAS